MKTNQSYLNILNLSYLRLNSIAMELYQECIRMYLLCKHISSQLHHSLAYQVNSLLME